MTFVRFALLALAPLIAVVGAVVIGATATPSFFALLGFLVLASLAPRLAHAPARVRRHR